MAGYCQISSPSSIDRSMELGAGWQLAPAKQTPLRELTGFNGPLLDGMCTY